MRDLKDCREDIDRIDSEIIRLLNERRGVAEDIAECKLKDGKGISDQGREEAKLKAVMEQSRSMGLPGQFGADVYRSIMRGTVAYERRYIVERLRGGGIRRGTSISYLGGVGSYSHLAAARFTDFYTGDVRMEGCSNFEKVEACVASGNCEFGILPIENSSSGSINQVLDVLQGSSATFVGEVFYPIDHAVLTCGPADVGTITDIYAHPQPIEQCSRFIRDFMPKAAIHYMKASSEAMREVQSLADPHCAAIAGHHAGSYYGLMPVMDNIANNTHNYTRFVVISMTPITVPENVPAKTSLSFTVQKYAPGSLIRVLGEFSSRGINLTKLISRPSLSSGHGTWEEIFFADVQANLSSPAMQECLERLKGETSRLKILGCYESDEETPA
ncbi:MAG: bifunctional chorismate mutase/prephenate dehydratase [Succinivibrio sp.]